MSKTSKRAISIFVCLLLVLTALAVSALAAPSDFTVTVSADTDSAKPGDVVTVNVKVTGHQFCAVDVELNYDTVSFDYVSSMSGWSDDGTGRLRMVNANASGGYWEDGKVLGTFKFMVKDNAPTGEAAFCVGKENNVFIVGDWAEGASSEAAKPLEAHQLINAVVTVKDGQGESEPQSDYGAISDDGSTLNIEAGHKVYSIPDSDDEKVVWKSSNESVVTVDESGLVTAVSDGDAILTATDEAGNELEQRTVIVGAVTEETIPEDVKDEEPQSEQNADMTPDVTEIIEPKTEVEETKTASSYVWLIIAAAAVIIAAVAVFTVKKKRKEQ